MITLNVELGSRSYPIHIGSNLITQADLFAPHIKGSTCAVVTNTTVDPLYGEALRATLASLGKSVTWIVLPDGEVYKEWHTFNQIFEKLLLAQASRKTTLIALGGGVVGDMTGFAAACYMRGVPFIQVPTTLLAQVDSSVGGKTGINHALGKNMIGAFYQPQAVIADTSTLHTLPSREWIAGLAEIIKIAAVADSAFLDWIDSRITALNARDETATVEAVHWACKLKAAIVGADEKELGNRAILNFGHTLAHAIETNMGYGQWLHGEAVGCGMVFAADLSVRVDTLSDAQRRRLVDLIRAAGLPITPPTLSAQCYMESMRVDKKSDAGQINFVLLKSLGEACVKPVSDSDLYAVLAQSMQ